MKPARLRSANARKVPKSCSGSSLVTTAETPAMGHSLRAVLQLWRETSWQIGFVR